MMVNYLVEKAKSYPLTIVMVEPRQLQLPAAAASSATSETLAWDSFVLPQNVYARDVLRLISGLANVVQLLTRINDIATHELLQHPERVQGFQMMRRLLAYTDETHTQLVQRTLDSPLRESRPVRLQLGNTFYTRSSLSGFLEIETANDAASDGNDN
ncbi:uncharacterized protein LOC108604438 [Drosophila busckii]|uniref:uncharacterized protein LOC108604438 n=1 Tax=Drosophila busckii TaxID=30019 RepID=UPI0014329875|nr:uncharacterized protein LOC108604438 [Drosophila busckii]